MRARSVRSSGVTLLLGQPVGAAPEEYLGPVLPRQLPNALHLRDLSVLHLLLQVSCCHSSCQIRCMRRLVACSITAGALHRLSVAKLVWRNKLEDPELTELPAQLRELLVEISDEREKSVGVVASRR